MADTPTSYPFDPTGTATTNLISGEQHVITGAGSPNFNIFVPDFAPFFPESAVVTGVAQDGTSKTMVEGVDILFTHDFYTASLRTGKRVCGSVSMLDWQWKGVISITYQTIGGIWTLDTAAIDKILGDAVHNPRVTTWEQVTYRPYDFPPIVHTQDVSTFVGADDLVTALNAIETAIRESSSGGGTSPGTVTKESIGLGNVENYGIAQDADAQNPVSDALYMTPKKTAEVIDNYPGAAFTTFVARRDNPNQVTAAQVGSYTTAQVDAAINSAVTTLNGSVGNLTNSLNQHLADQTNPHKTTAAQVGAYTKTEVDTLLASKLDASGTANNSTKWNNWTAADAATNFKPNNAGNADTLGNQTSAQLQDTFFQYVEANLDTLGGKTVAQIESDVTTAVSAALTGSTTPVDGQTSSSALAKRYTYAALNTADTNRWVMIGYATVDTAATVNDTDWQFFLSGGEAPATAISPLYLAAVSMRVSGGAVHPTMSVVNMRGSDWADINNGQFALGLRISSGTGTTLNVEVWVKSGGTRTQFLVSDMSARTWTQAPAISQNTEPDSITYPTETLISAGSSDADLSTELDSYVSAMVDTLNALTTAVTAIVNTPPTGTELDNDAYVKQSTFDSSVQSLTDLINQKSTTLG